MLAILAATARPAFTAPAPAKSSAVRPQGARTTTARPDLSGTWELDVARSDFGQGTGTEPPKGRTDVIVHRDPELQVTMTVRKSKSEMTTPYTYVTDGASRVIRLSGQDIHYTAAWSGDTLRVDTRAKILVFEAVVRERWRMAPDRRSLTIARHVKSPLGEGDQVLRFRRTSPVQGSVAGE